MPDDLQILLIDDNAADRALVVALLSQALEAARIWEIDGALEFAEALGRHPWSVAIGERRLGWADGEALLRTVKQQHPMCRTILFATEAPEELGTFGNQGSIDVYVRKESTGFLRLPELLRETVSEPALAPSSWRSPLLRGGIDAAPVGYFWVLSDGTILGANHALAALLGYPGPEAMVGQSLLSFLGDPVTRPDIERSLSRGSRESFIPATLVPPGGREHPCVMSFWPVTDDQERACLEGMVWETEREARHAAPGKEASSARGIDPAKSDVFAGGAEPTGRVVPMRTAVASALPSGARPRLPLPGAGATTTKEPPPDQTSDSGARPPRGPVDAPELSEERDPFESVPLKEAVLGAMEKLRPLIAATNARILAATLPTITANRTEMVRLFRELIENALKYRAQARPQISVRAHERVGGWLITVSDNGIGLSTEAQQALFGRAKGDVAEQHGSGFDICQRIAARYGGNIWLTSQRGEGTTIFIELNSSLTASDTTPLSIQLNGEAMGEVEVTNQSSKREIAQAALSLPRLQQRIGAQAIKYVQFVDRGVVNIVA